MNQLFRALYMPKGRLLKKILGHKEVYALAMRKIKNQDFLLETTDIKIQYKELFREDNYWYADPIIYKENEKTVLFFEKFNISRKKGEIACSVLKNGKFENPTTVLCESVHMSFPMIFKWNEKIYMIPETSEDKSIRIYEAKEYPYKWELKVKFDVEMAIVDSTVLHVTNNEILVLASEVEKDNGLKTRYIKYKVVSLGDDYEIIIDKNGKNNNFNYIERNAGRILDFHNQKVIPTQESTIIDYGVYLNFKELDDTYAPKNIIKKVSPKNILIEGLDERSFVGIHTYACCDDYEIIDMRYLK